MPSPTALTLQALRRHGYAVDVCERFIAQANIRRDLFGIFDLVALDRRQPAIIGIQVTSAGHVADRLRKIKARPELALWLKCGGRAWVVGWYKTSTGNWKDRTIEVQPGDMAAGPITLQAPVRRGRRSTQRGLFD